MREKFRQHHRLTDEERAELLQTCTFAFDTNVLLNIYRYADSTREDLFRVLRALKTRIWIPNQVAVEFYRQRLDVIQKQRSKYEELLTTLRSAVEGLHDGGFRKSAFLKLDELEKLIKPGVEEAEKLLEQQRAEHPNLTLNDPYLETLAEIVGTAIGEPYAVDRVQAIYGEAEARIAEKQPPGYRDAAKPIPERYGDIVIWYQLIDYAIKSKTPVVFITDDDKDDWWLNIAGQKLGPRPELREEMRTKAGVDFYLYKPAYLLEVAGTDLKLEVAASSIDDAKETGAALQRTAGSYVQHVSGSAHTYWSRGGLRSNEGQRADTSEVEGVVLEWLRGEHPNHSVDRVRSGPVRFMARDGDRVTGFGFRYVAEPHQLSFLRMRLPEIAFRIFHQLSEGQLSAFYHIVVFKDNEEILEAMDQLWRMNRREPAYPIIVGFINEWGKFVTTGTISAPDRW